MKGALRWKCDEKGCYAEKSKPHLEDFSDVLPGKISFSDLDAVVEIRGNFLLLEFKSGDARPLPTGQRLLIERLTRESPKMTAVVVFLGEDGRQVRAVTVCKGGRWWPVEICNTERLRGRISAWSQRALGVAP